MRRLKNYSILSLTIVMLVFSSTQSSQTQEPASKFVKARNPIPNRYIVVLKDDVVSDKDSLEVRRAGVTAIANSHAQTYGGKVDYIYETALKGYAIELPDEAAAIAISNLPQVRWVEQDSFGSFASGVAQKTPEAVCRGKSVPVTLLDRPYGLKMTGRRTSYVRGGISRRARLVIRSRDEFNELWQEILRGSPKNTPLPEVDFSREMLIVAATGQHTTSGEIIIESACDVDTQLEVSVRSTRFVVCGLQIGVPPWPMDMVRVPKTDLPVVFRETEVIPDCKELLRPGG